MIQLTTGILTEKICDFQIFCKKNNLTINYFNSMGTYAHVSVSGEGRSVDKFCQLKDKWDREKYLSSFWYKLLKFLKLEQ